LPTDGWCSTAGGQSGRPRSVKWFLTHFCY